RRRPAPPHHCSIDRATPPPPAIRRARRTPPLHARAKTTHAGPRKHASAFAQRRLPPVTASGAAAEATCRAVEERRSACSHRRLIRVSPSGAAAYSSLRDRRKYFPVGSIARVPTPRDGGSAAIRRERIAACARQSRNELYASAPPATSLKSAVFCVVEGTARRAAMPQKNAIFASRTNLRMRALRCREDAVFCVAARRADAR